MHPALYRASQFFAALKAGLPGWLGGLSARLPAADAALVDAILPEDARRLFRQMPPNDRRHAIAVARTLRPAGYTGLAIMQAALLHDVAKSIGQPIPHRVAIVLLEAFWPAALVKLSELQIANGKFSATGDDSSTGPFADSQLRAVPWWRRPFVVHAWHPQIGAEWARQAGCDPLAVNLILRHQDKLRVIATEEDKLLAALQWADNLN
ncbi:MAG: hypothetical protein Kow0031_11030 [Anaerolineae bacterium]